MASINPDSVVIRLAPAIKLAIEAGVYDGLVKATAEITNMEYDTIGAVADHVTPQVVLRVLAVLGLD